MAANGTHHVNVFTLDGRGGNPCPIALDATELSNAEMQAIARRYGHESSFVLPAPNADYDHRFRFWVPNHEMEMCGHATIGSIWLLAQLGHITAGEVRIATLSGPVTGYIARGSNGLPDVEITQPAGRVLSLDREAEAGVLRVLKLNRADLLDLPIQNAVTSRVKTLIPLRDPDRLHALASDMPAVEAVCSAIGSTGLYPFAPLEPAARTSKPGSFPAHPDIPRTQRPASPPPRSRSAFCATDRSRRMPARSASTRAVPWASFPKSACVWALPASARSAACSAAPSPLEL